MCNHDSWCTISDDKVYVRCVRVPSNRPSHSKRGEHAWVHVLDGKTPDFEVVPVYSRKYRDRHEVLASVCKFYEHPDAQEVRRDVAAQLGVSSRALDAMRVGFGVDGNGAEFSSWPSKDAGGEYIGITRRYFDGSKKTIFRMQSGLFYSDTPGALSQNPVLIVEGGSDVAAAFTIGLCAIGRPSNTGGASMIRNMGFNKMIVLGENDEQPEKRGKFQWCPIDCPGCSHCFPGLFGAKLTAEQLGCKYIMPPNGCKDLRDVLANRKVTEFIKQLTRM